MTIDRLITLALLLAWLDVVKEFDVDYVIIERDGKLVSVPKDDLDARVRNYGSVSLGVDAEFWFPKAMSRWKVQIRKRRVLESYIELAKNLDRKGFTTPYPPS